MDQLYLSISGVQLLKDTKTDLEDKYAFVRWLNPSAAQFTYSDDEVIFNLSL